MIAQQAHQWITTCLAQARQLFYTVYNDQNIQNAKDIVQHIVFWIQKAWEQLQFQYYSTHFSMKGFYQQIINVCDNEGIVISCKILGIHFNPLGWKDVP